MVVREYVNRRQEFINSKKRGNLDEPCKRHQSNPGSQEPNGRGFDASESEDHDPTKKPRLEQFIERFEAEVKRVNQTYKESKTQFENDMKSFRDQDIQNEEEAIDKHMNEANGGMGKKDNKSCTLTINNKQNPSLNDASNCSEQAEKPLLNNK